MKKINSYAIILLGLLLFVGCQKDSSTEPGIDTKGSLVVKITDAPFPVSLVSEANITINKIEVRNENENDSSAFLTVFEDTATYNLIDLRNALTETLAEIEIPVGMYDLVRVYVADASIVLTDGREFDLKVPSGAQTGIKIFVASPIQVQSELTAELLLDFDLSKSFKVQGNPLTPAGIKGFIFTPVIRAVNTSSAGRIVGTVSDTTSTVIADAEVWVEQDTVVSSTSSDTEGLYAIIGLPAGSYSAYATKTGYDTVSVANVDVVAGNQQRVDFVLTLQ